MLVEFEQEARAVRSNITTSEVGVAAGFGKL